jgi:nucleoside-diphosphate-sugar epimerase
MKILVTGGAGYVGTKLVPNLLEKNHEVTVLDLFWFGDKLNEHRNLIKINEDVRNIKKLNLNKYDLIIHLASIANDPCTELDLHLSWDISVSGTCELVDHAVKCGVKRIIYASSASVYGIQKSEKVTEELELYPLSVYNKAKIAAERILLSYSEKIKIQILRPATVCGYSERMRLDVAVNLLTMQALKSNQITVLGGEQYRPNIHIEDMVMGYEYMIEREDLTGIYNLGFENLKIKDIAEIIARKTGAKINIEKSNDSRSYRLDSSKILATGFKPKRSVEYAINEITEKYKNRELIDEDKFYNVRWMSYLNGEKKLK